MTDKIQKKYQEDLVESSPEETDLDRRKAEREVIDQIHESKDAIKDIVNGDKANNLFQESTAQQSPHGRIKAAISTKLNNHPEFIRIYKQFLKKDIELTYKSDIILALFQEIETVLGSVNGAEEEKFQAVVDVFNNPNIAYYYDILIHYLTLKCESFGEMYLIPPYIWSILEKKGLATIPALVGIVNLEYDITNKETKSFEMKKEVQKDFFNYEIEASKLIRNELSNVLEYEKDMQQEAIRKIIPKNIQEYIVHRPDQEKLLELMYAINYVSEGVKTFTAEYINTLSPALHNRGIIDCDFTALIVNQYLKRAGISELNAIFITEHASLIIPGTDIVFDTYDCKFRMLPEFLMNNTATRKEIQTYIEHNEEKAFEENELHKKEQIFLEQPEHLKQFYQIRTASTLPASVISGFGIIYEKVLQEDSKAVAFHDTAIILDPQDYYAYYNKGIFYQYSDKGFESSYAAELQYTQCTRINPNNPQAYYALGNLYRDKKDYSKASSYYHKALSINNRSPEVLNEIGNINKYEGHNEEALKYYRRAYTYNPKFAPVLYNLVEYYENFYDKAFLKKYLIELSKVSSDSNIFNKLYSVLKTDSPESRETFEVGIARLRSSFEKYYSESNTLTRDRLLHSFKDLFNDYDKSTLLNERRDLTDIFNDISKIFVNTRQWGSAIEVLEVAEEYLPNNTFVLNDLGTCYSFLGKYDKALKYYLKANVESRDVKDINILTNIGSMYIFLKDYENAKIYLHQALRIKPNYQRAIQELDWVEKNEK